MLLVHGARIGYFQGDIRLLMDDLKNLKPTIFPVVPRLLNRMFDKVLLLSYTHINCLHLSLCLNILEDLYSLYNSCVCIKIFGQANTPLKRWLLDFATSRKEAELKSGVVRKDSMWDKLIFSKVQVTR